MIEPQTAHSCRWWRYTMCPPRTQQSSTPWSLSWALYFAYVLLGERWGSLGWAGAGLIVVSSLAAQILGTENQKKELPAPKQR